MIKLTREELRGKDVGDITEFPPLTSELIQLLNQKTHAVTKKNVGKPQALIESFVGKSYEAWSDWYETQHPGAIDTASDLILNRLEALRAAVAAIDPEMVKHWVKEAVLKKTYARFRLPEVILKKVARIRQEPIRLPTPDEEDRGIDGVIGETAYRVRPVSYYFKAPPGDTAEPATIYFEKTKSGVKIYHDA